MALNANAKSVDNLSGIADKWSSARANCMRHQISISIPERWQEGAIQIKGFIEHYLKAVGLDIAVQVGREGERRDIWITDAGQIDRNEYESVDNAIQMLNEGLNRVRGDLPWNPKSDGLLQRLAGLNRAFRKPIQD